MTTTLSVLMPVRNGASTLALAVRSTLRALPKGSELVILDDASTDRTPQILAEFADPRLRVITSEDGLGVAGGLNRLLAETDSPFVGRMDADDVTLPWRLHLQLRTLARMSASATFTSVFQWQPGRCRVTPPSPLPIGVDAFPFHLMLRNPVSHPAMMARRSALEAVEGYRPVPSEDYDLWLRLSLDGFQMSRTMVPGLAYRLHSSQITASRNWRHASWTDERTSQTFSELSARLLGSPFPRLTAVAIDASISIPEFRRTLESFRNAFIVHSRSLRRIDRINLLRLLERRLDNARRIRRDLQPEDSGA